MFSAEIPSSLMLFVFPDRGLMKSSFTNFGWRLIFHPNHFLCSFSSSWWVCIVFSQQCPDSLLTNYTNSAAGDALRQHKLFITGSFAALLKVVYVGCFRNVKCCFPPLDSRLFEVVSRFKTENICWQAFSFIRSLSLAVVFSFLHTANSDFSVDLSLLATSDV